ncbi:hypothetical protein ACWG0P_05625 [Amedibacillus sp. YH-ame6]
MKKLKVFLTGAMAFAMMMPMGMTAVNAAESDPDSGDYNSQTDVSFDDRNIIPDPDHPESPEWGIQIPSTVKLTKNNVGADNGVDVSVKMVTMAEDGELTDSSVKVWVKSGNVYKLKDTTTTQLRYGLTYTQSGAIGADVSITDKTSNANGYLQVADITGAKSDNTKATVEGKAYLLQTPTKSGNLTDTLTYVVTTGSTSAPSTGK